MKSALELAMEKTAQKEGAKPTEKQKREIEEIRSIAKAKAAEEEIMAQGQIASADPAKAKELKELSAARIRKIMADAEAKIEKARQSR